MFFSKKFKPIEEYGDSWSVKQGDNSGHPIFVRVRESLAEAVGHPGYPFQIGVAIPLLHPTDEGLPSKEETDELYKIEDELDKTFAQDAVFAISISTSGMRELVFYAKEWKPEEFEQKIKAVNERFSSHELQFMMQQDPKWETFKSFL